MIFSGKRFQYVENTEYNPPCIRNSYLIESSNSNCTVQVDDWPSYDKIIYGLWIKFFGRDFDTEVTKLI